MFVVYELRIPVLIMIKRESIRVPVGPLIFIIMGGYLIAA